MVRFLPPPPHPTKVVLCTRLSLSCSLLITCGFSALRKHFKMLVFNRLHNWKVVEIVRLLIQLYEPLEKVYNNETKKKGLHNIYI